MLIAYFRDMLIFDAMLILARVWYSDKKSLRESRSPIQHAFLTPPKQILVDDLLHNQRLNLLILVNSDSRNFKD